MKISMIAPTPFFADRGCHIRILEEAKAIRSTGNEITIYTYHLGRDVDNFEIKRIMNIPWYNKLEAGPSYHMLYLDPLLMFRTFQQTLIKNPDVIHAHLHEGALIGKFCSRSRIKKIPLIFDAQGSLASEMVAHNFLSENSLGNRFFSRVETIIDNMADAIIASSINAAEILRERGILKEIYIIPDGVNTELFKPGYDVNNLRENLNLPNDKSVVVYTGLLTEYQGIDLLLSAIPTVIEQLKDVTFLIIGYPAKKYKEMAKSLKIMDNIIFTGKVHYNEIPKYLCLGDLAVSPKILESGEANLKLYTYMASGLPTIVFDYPANREVLGEFGIYVKEKNSAALAEVLIETIINEELIKTRGNKARKKAVNEYSWEKTGQKIMEVYERARQ